MSHRQYDRIETPESLIASLRDMLGDRLSTAARRS